ncbi:MAG: DUF3999 family protein [Desulfosudis oleivorans]|nr:DUF3999 family protein [Desulfosudis oleivorans]
MLVPGAMIAVAAASAPLAVRRRSAPTYVALAALPVVVPALLAVLWLSMESRRRGRRRCPTCRCSTRSTSPPRSWLLALRPLVHGSGAACSAARGASCTAARAGRARRGGLRVDERDPVPLAAPLRRHRLQLGGDGLLGAGAGGGVAVLERTARWCWSQLAVRLRHRVLWFTGAALLAVVVAKLFLVDLAEYRDHGAHRVVHRRRRAAAHHRLSVAGAAAHRAAGRTGMKRILALTLLAGASLAFAADAPLQPDDFAFGFAIEPVAGAPLQQVTLPAAVYQSATRADLGDLRVFNAAGERGAARAAPAGAGDRPPATGRRCRCFRCAARRARSPEELSLRVEKSASRRDRQRALRRRRDRRRAGGGVAHRRQRRRRAVRGARGRLARPGGRRLQRQAAHRGERRPALLAHRHRRAALARLRHDGQLLERRRIELCAQRAKYLRLSLARSRRTCDAAHRRCARERVVRYRSPPAREWVALSGRVARRGGPASTGSSCGGRGMPVERARRVRLPQPNMVATMDLRSRERATDPWRMRASGLLYRQPERPRGSPTTSSRSPTAAAIPTGGSAWRARRYPGRAGDRVRLGAADAGVRGARRRPVPPRLRRRRARARRLQRRAVVAAVRGAQRHRNPCSPRLGAALTLGGPERLELPLSALPVAALAAVGRARPRRGAARLDGVAARAPAEAGGRGVINPGIGL